MFCSKLREIIIPQDEHAQLSAFLASIWGNLDFDTPELEFSSFLLGVRFHDRGYDPYDIWPITETEENQWLLLQQLGIDRCCEDPIQNLVILFHIRRLLTYRETPKRIAFRAELDKRIQNQLAVENLEARPFEWADRITHFCDNVSFDFCFEVPKGAKAAVCPQRNSDSTVEIRYEILPGGRIRVEPWPFSVEEFRSFIVGYQAKDYPRRLEAVHLPIHVAPFDN